MTVISADVTATDAALKEKRMVMDADATVMDADAEATTTNAIKKEARDLGSEEIEIEIEEIKICKSTSFHLICHIKFINRIRSLQAPFLGILVSSRLAKCISCMCSAILLDPLNEETKTIAILNLLNR